jgi:hypothetical protein
MVKLTTTPTVERPAVPKGARAEEKLKFARA